MMIDHLVIIGVGLIGGSLARALRKANQVGRITAYDRCGKTLKKAIHLGVIDDYAMTIPEVIEDADVLVIATPLATTEKIMPEIAASLAKKTIVTDVGSTKASVVNIARAVFGEAVSRFVPGHPIAGTEQSGVGASFADLFVDHRVILTPLKETNEIAYKVVADMWHVVGAEVIDLDVIHHDEVLAATSHLPHMLAYALVDCLALMQERDEIFRYAAGGFADFTRIASSNPEMWHDICLSNRTALLKMLDKFAEHTSQIKSAIENNDSKQLLTLFKRAKQSRDGFVMNRKEKESTVE